LIYKIYAVNKVAFPLQAYRDFKSFKLYLSDVGLLSQMAKMNPDIIIDDDKFFQEFKGALTEQFVLQELVASEANNISYWTNESGTAEIDFIFEKNSQFYPLEVKATENLQSKSLRVFKEKNPQILCYRSSLSNYREEDWMTNVPLYALKQTLLD
jgi:predicted AAA+ superfamily ATPase